MIILLLERKEKLSSFDNKVIKWIKRNIRSENIDYRLLFVKSYLADSDISKLNLHDKNVQFIFWSGKLAKNNLSIVKQFPNSIVILSKHTMLGINSDWFNENDAINHNLNIMYLTEEEQEYNREWKLAIRPDFYSISQKRILDQIYDDPKNFKNYCNEEFEDTFESITKNQF